MKNIINNKKITIGRDSKYCLIGKINGLSDAVKRARARILKGKTDFARNDMAISKRNIGIEARHHLLAYAFLRNVPYISVEKTCGSGNKPNAELILKIINFHLYSFEVKRNICTIDHIQSWLKGENHAI